MKKITSQLVSLLLMLALLAGAAMPVLAEDQTAAAASQSHRITTTVTGGHITSGADVAQGSDMKLAWKADTGRHLASVAINGTAVDITTVAEGTELKNIQADCHVDVVFAADDADRAGASESADITTGIVNGSIDVVRPSGEKGAALVHYAANEGYEVSNIIVDGAIVDASAFPTAYLFSDGKAHHINVVCTPVSPDKASKDSFAITTAALGGTIDPTVTVARGQNATIHYAAKPGWQLMELVVDGKAVANADAAAYTFAGVDRSHSIQAVFEQTWAADVKATATEPEVEQPLYTITTSVRNGTIDESTGVKAGESITIHYSPNAGYTLRKLTVDGEDVDVEKYPNEYTFTNVSSDRRIYAVYRKAASGDSDSDTASASSSSSGGSSSDSSKKSKTSTTSSKGSNAKTGDYAGILPWVLLLTGSGIALTAGAVHMRRKVRK